MISVVFAISWSLCKVINILLLIYTRTLKFDVILSHIDKCLVISDKVWNICMILHYSVQHLNIRRERQVLSRQSMKRYVYNEKVHVWILYKKKSNVKKYENCFAKKSKKSRFTLKCNLKNNYLPFVQGGRLRLHFQQYSSFYSCVCEISNMTFYEVVYSRTCHMLQTRNAMLIL